MKVAVVGLGRMGRRHVQAVRDLGADIVGAADPREENARIAADEHHLAPSVMFRDATELLRATRPECLVVATTAPGHCPITLAAIDAGVGFVLCEKPLASSLAECDAMVAAARRQGTRLAVNHQMRFMDQYLEAKRILESPEFGGWASINVIAGNLGIAMNGTHYFELLRWLASETPSTVNAWFAAEKVASPRGPEFSDRAGQVRVATPSGKRLYLEAGADQGHGVRVTYAGGTGMLVADELAGQIEYSTRLAEHRALPTSRYGMPGTSERHAVTPADAVLPTRRVLEALLAERDYPTGEDGRTAFETLVAAFVSSESGGATVDLRSTQLPRERRFDHA
jgi:predicted dehydrogenase